MSNWVFLTNHAHVLLAIARHSDVTVREIARQVGVTERTVTGIVHELEQDGYVRSRRVGRRKQYAVEARRRLRHPLVSTHRVGELLEVLAPVANA
jgi:DNA-binding MarR family transcriptional regulator